MCIKNILKSVYEAGRNPLHLPGSHHIDPNMPRHAGWQQLNEKVFIDYWKKAIYAPLGDHLAMEMREVNS